MVLFEKPKIVEPVHVFDGTYDKLVAEGYFSEILALKGTGPIDHVIKLLKQYGDPELFIRAQTEAQAGLFLSNQHPRGQIVHYIDSEEVYRYNENVATGMKYYPDGCLTDLMGSDYVTLDFLLFQAADIASALVCLDSSGIVNRDLKPDNVFIKGERSFVGDFGLALVREESPLYGGLSRNIREMYSNERTKIVGSPSWMCPDSIITPFVKPSADLFSLGTILYEMLTGHVFNSDSAIKSIGKANNVEDLSMGLGQYKNQVRDQLLKSLGTLMAERWPDISIEELSSEYQTFEESLSWSLDVNPEDRILAHDFRKKIIDFAKKLREIRFEKMRTTRNLREQVAFAG
jgi:serine/threonine protein kinase